MQRILLTGIVLFGLVVPSHANTWADKLFVELSRDFGSVPRGSVVEHPFRLINKTDEVVRIAHIRVSCGCITAKALKTVLQPGEETAVIARMDTRRFQDTKNVTIYVQFDQPQSQEVRLWVQANSRADVMVYPDSLAFGRIRKGTSATKKVSISLLGSRKFEIVGVSTESNYIKPAVRLVKRGFREVSYELSAELRSDAPVGKWFTDIWVQTNNPAVPKVRVPLMVEIESTFSVSPGTVNLGRVQAGARSDRKIILRGSQPFRILGFAGIDNHLQVRGNEADSKLVHVLTVTLYPLQVGEWNRTIRVFTDLPMTQSIEFDAKATVVR